MDKPMKPGTIKKSSLGQKVHSDELSDHLFDIISKYSPVSGKKTHRWPPC
jgi:hypothetical protein